MKNFAELFCERHHIAHDRYERAMFWRCLHRRAWPLVAMLNGRSSDYFAPDRELIRAVGQLTRAGALTEELTDFYSHPGNVGFARRRLRIRLSVGRLSRLVNRVLPESSRTQSPDSPVANKTRGGP